MYQLCRNMKINICQWRLNNRAMKTRGAGHRSAGSLQLKKKRARWRAAAGSCDSSSGSMYITCLSACGPGPGLCEGLWLGWAVHTGLSSFSQCLSGQTFGKKWPQGCRENGCL